MIKSSEQIVDNAVRAVNRPVAYSNIVNKALKIDSVRGNAMGELVITLSDDKRMRELIKNFTSQSFSMKRAADPLFVDEGQREDFITDMVQFAAAVMVATRQSARA
jgi:hypothetical protein